MALIVGAWLMLRAGVGIGRVRIESTATGDTVARYLVDVALLLFLLALARLSAMLGAVAGGSLFSPAVTRPFRGFALFLLLSTICQLLVQPLDAMLVASRLGGRHTALEFEMSSVITMVGALFLFLIARMLDSARALEAELEEFV